MTLRLLTAIALLVGIGPTTSRADEAEPGAAMKRLRAAVKRHPDDPDLAWALVRELARSDPPAALAELEAHRVRWPDRHPDALRLEGELRVRVGDVEAGLERLESHLERHPDDGVARFHRALALRALGRRAEAADELIEARRLESALAAESLVLEAIDRIENGETERGRRLLERALRLEPDSELAAQARRILIQPTLGARPEWVLTAHGGIEWDSNVTLDSGLGLAGLPRDRSDWQLLFGAGVLWNALRRDRLGVTLGYRYDESEHDELDSYDLRSHLLFASTLFRLSERAALRLDTRLSRLELDNDRYLRSEAVQPNAFLAFGGRKGILQLFAHLENREYHDDPLLSSLERDGLVFGAGLEHTLPLPEWADRFSADRPGWFALGVRFDRTRTDGARDLFQLDSAYDHDRSEARMRARLPLPWKIEAIPSVSVAHEDYRYRNVIDLLTDDGVGTLDPDEREDTVFEGRLSLVRPVHPRVRLELAWRGTRRVSNVDLYDYERHVIGLYVRATSR